MTTPTSDLTKRDLLQDLHTRLHQQGFAVDVLDLDRPWGGLLAIDARQADFFAHAYFAGPAAGPLEEVAYSSPKVLVVGPQQPLAWQRYRNEEQRWKVVAGPVALVTRTEAGEQQTSFPAGALITVPAQQWHHLLGLGGWAVVATICQPAPR